MELFKIVCKIEFMNQDVYNLLKKLKLSYGVTSLKAEFEAEGASFEDVLLLKQYCDFVGLDLTLKIGGCEAVRDIKDAKLIGVNNIVAPMIETPFALKKFVNAINNIYDIPPKLFINIESCTAVRNFNEIVNSKEFAQITGVVIGRSDLLKSYEFDDFNSIFGITKKIVEKTISCGKNTIIGGNICPNSVDFLLNIENLPAFETRKVVFDMSIMRNPSDLKKAISEALSFEILLLENKLKTSDIKYTMDIERLSALKKRLNSYSII